MTIARSRISDEVFAEMIDCTPPVERPETVPVPVPPEATPIRDAMVATIEQTGSGPPPDED